MKFLTGTSFPALPFVVTNEGGEILRSGFAPAELVDAQAKTGEFVFAGLALQATQYIDVSSGTLMEKPPITPVVSGFEVYGLPPGCVATAEGQAFEETNGSITFHFDVPGTYFVALTAKNYLPASVELVQS